MNEQTLDMLSNLKEYMRKDDVTSFIKTIHKNMPVWNNIKEDILEHSIEYVRNYTNKVEEELLDPNPVFGKYAYICVELGANIHKTKGNIKQTLHKIYDAIDRYIVTYKHKYNIQSYEKGLTNYISFFMYITSLYTPYKHIYELTDPKDKKRHFEIYFQIRNKHIEFIELIHENKKKIQLLIKSIISPSAINKSYKLFKQITKKITNTSKNRTQRVLVQKSEPNQVKPRSPQHRTYFIKNGRKIPIGYTSMVDSIFGKNFRERASAQRARATAPRTAQRNMPRESARATATRSNARANSPKATASRTTARTNAPRTTAPRASSPRATASRHSATAPRKGENIIRDNIKIRRIENELSELLIEIEELTRKIRSSRDTAQMTQDIKRLNPKNIRYNELKEEYEELISQQKIKM